MQTLLIGTKNQAKIVEFSVWLTLHDIPFKTLNEFPNVPDAKETGATFEENAKIKAKSYYEATGLRTLADDGGFEIEHLHGAPGVHSKRWVHGDERESTDEEIIEFTLVKLRGVVEGKRGARLRSVLAFYDGHEYTLADASIDGTVAHSAGNYSPGFPYRGLLFVTRFGKMYDELTPEEFESVNQRFLGLEKLKPVLLERLK